MPFYRFENLEKKTFNPHLSTGQAQGVHGTYIFFSKVHKEAGTGSELHYHPNELIVFPLEGKINVLVGKDRRIVSPGSFVHIPPCAHHQVKATEDGPENHLYIKDRTWTMIGVAADEPLPDRAPTVEEVGKKFEKGLWPGLGKESGESAARTEGLGNCYYSLLHSLDSPPASGKCDFCIEGNRMAFGFTELPGGYGEQHPESAHEQFYYIVSGSLEARVNDDREQVGSKGTIHIPKGSSYSFTVTGSTPVRLVYVRSTTNLETACDAAK